MIVWPARLPLPQRAGNGRTLVDHAARSDIKAGPVQARLRFAATIETTTLTWIFTANQLADFDGWWQDIAHYGAAWFTLPLRGMRSTLGPIAHTVRLAEGYTATLVGDRWKVTASAEISFPDHG